MTSQEVPLLGHVVAGVSEYRTAKAWSRLSLAGKPPAPSFQFQLLISCGSLEPPPVKMVALMVHDCDAVRLVSQVHKPAVEPLVLDDVPQMPGLAPYW